jgi:Phosphotransferase enzyme family
MTRHKGGVLDEAAVCNRVLWTSRATSPMFYGAYRDVQTGDTWLILEYLDDSVRLRSKLESSAAMGLAARWIGRFHNATEERLSGVSMRILSRYDARYYLAWARQTPLLAGHLRSRSPWLTSLCRHFEDVLALSLALPPTVFHAEYYSSNVLFRGETVYPIEWESAAVTASEIDLATLVLGASGRIGVMRRKFLCADSNNCVLWANVWN